MKKLLYTLTLLLVILGCNRTDYSELTERMDDMEERIVALEKLCNRMNSDLMSLQSVVSAFQQNDLITKITPIEDGETVIGYVIEFSQSPALTIYHGKNGQDAPSPQIGAREDADGNYYWTLDGEWLTDSEGRRIRAGAQDGKEGITPQLKIENGYWHVSYDNGATWKQLGKADSEGDDASPLFKGSGSLTTASSSLWRTVP